MVKYLKAWLPIAAALLLVCGCNVDFIGLFTSTGLEERLKERSNFTFIDNYSERGPLVGSSYSFIVLTDVHIDNSDARGLERLIDVITDDIKFVVILGDITQRGTRVEIEKFIEFAVSLRSKSVPCYPVIGNHDIFFGNWPVWKEYIGSTSYRIDGGTVTLFILDSANSYLGKAQLDWLERELASTRRDVFVFTHGNLFVKNPADTRSQSDTRERARVVNMLRDKGDIVFMGHLHKEIVREAGNVLYISVDAFRDMKNYCVVTVRDGGENAEITYRFERL